MPYCKACSELTSKRGSKEDLAGKANARLTPQVPPLPAAFDGMHHQHMHLRMMYQSAACQQQYRHQLFKSKLLALQRGVCPAACTC